jgi:mono/diheme cytochrome c family protein
VKDDWWRRGCLLATLALGILWTGCSSPDGQELYTKNCARCHGADGRGDPRQVGLYPDLNLTEAAPVKMQARGVLYRRISQGYGAMPAFAGKLQEDELAALVSYMNRFVAVPRGH